MLFSRPLNFYSKLETLSYHAGALVLILNFQFSARPEGTLSQSEATERILNFS